MELHEINPKEVIVLEGRMRKKFDRDKISNLAQSIRSMGQLQPGICWLRPDGSFELVAGERRLRACREAEVPFRFVLRSEIIDPVLLKEIELEENLQRENLTWQEEAAARLELHELKQQVHGKAIGKPGAHGGWSLEDTAESLGISRAILGEDVELAMWAKEIPEVAGARNKTEAKKVVKRLKGMLEREEALDEIKAKVDITKIQTAVLEGEDPDKDESQLASPLGEQAGYELLVASYMERIHEGSMEQVLESFPDKHFQIVIWDPPWGVDFDTVGKLSSEKQQYADSKDQFFESFKPWLDLLWRKMSLDSHLYCFFGIVNHEFIYSTLESVGFQCDRIPIIWHKTTVRSIRQAHLWPARSYEPIAFARKGSKKLERMGMSNVVPTPGPTPRMKVDHPSAKHPNIIRSLLDRSGFPGDRVLDPMCGSGMTGVACDIMKSTHAFDWTLIERESSFYTLAVANCLKGYAAVVHDMLKPDEFTPVDFRDLIPGTSEWRDHWETHPDEQEAMLEWRKETQA